MAELISQKPATWRDYYDICKPRVVFLMLLTSIVGMFLAVPGMVPIDILFFGNLGIALVASSGAAVNHLIDHKIDIQMSRTHDRPVAQGRVSQMRAGLFALSIGTAGMATLMIWVNALSAWLTLGSFIGYAFIYTGYLKHATPQNIVIGGLAGAMPPMLGWSAVTNTIDPNALILVLIIFAWTPPHFWALAIHRKDEYAKSGIPMLPVTHGVRVTKLHILAYTLGLVLVTVLPYYTGMSGPFYLISALIFGVRFIFWSAKLLFRPTETTAMDTFRFSIVYLAAIFVALMIDHYIF